jgi:hypothetical protein
MTDGTTLVNDTQGDDDGMTLRRRHRLQGEAPHPAGKPDDGRPVDTHAHGGSRSASYIHTLDYRRLSHVAGNDGSRSLGKSSLEEGGRPLEPPT